MFSKKKAAPAKPAPEAAKPVAAATKPAGNDKAKKGGFLSFGKKKATASPAPAPTAKPPASGGAAPTPKPSGRGPGKAPAKAKGGSPLGLLIPLLLILALGGGAYYAYTRILAPASKSAAQVPTQPTESAQILASLPEAGTDTTDSLQTKPKAANRQATRTAEANPNAAAPATNDTNANPGAVTTDAASCAGQPRFVAKLGLGPDVSFDTSETHRLILLAPVPNSDAVSKYQNQSWGQAGFVAAFALDRAGNVYVAPSPRVGPGVRVAGPQNVIYKVDTNTGTLAEYLTLPDVNAPSPENVYGVLGLAYDCDTNSLYVSSVAGSTAAKEAGHIYRIDLNLNTIVGRFDNVDALSLAVGSDANGKVLYFGSARTPTIRAVSLEADGNFHGAPRDVGTLPDAERAARISFTSPTAMVVQAVAFDFANADTPPSTTVHLQYDAATDTWNPPQ
jgi:hypothetical protein